MLMPATHELNEAALMEAIHVIKMITIYAT